MSMRSLILAVTLAIAVFSNSAVAGVCKAASGSHSTALLELYTSEGCSSCPPADRWLSGLAGAGITPDKAVPLAFHVDYWDDIGWKDRFADPAYAQRQRDLVALAGDRTVYTPQVFMNGRDFRVRENDRPLQDAIRDINARRAPVSIQMSLESPGPQGFVVEARVQAANAALAPGLAREAAVYLALYENRLVSSVKAGENRGATLHHDYVIREWIGPIALDGSGSLSLKRALPLKPGQKAGDSGVAVVVQNRRSGDTLQALQLPACNG
jgi:hypothetical protein